MSLDRVEAILNTATALSTTEIPTLLTPVPVATPDRNPARVYLASLSEGSRRTMLTALTTLAEMATNGRADLDTCPWQRMRFQHTVGLRSRVAERFKPATANKHLSALRGTLKAAWRLKLIDSETYQRAVDLKVIRGSSVPAGRALSSGELRALFADCGADKTPAGARDAALLGLLYGCGVRRSEVVALKLNDYDAETGGVTLKKTKGKQERVVYCPPGAKAAMNAWILVRGTDPGPLFLPILKGRRVMWRHLDDQSVRDILAKRARRAGVAPFAPHDVRRSFVGDMLDAGADIVAVQQLAGHASPTTTSRYDRRGERAKRAAADLLHVPFAGEA